MQEQELFQSYEIRNWDFSPRVYKILAISAIFNVLALLTIAQTNLLTTKGCDSPLVGGVCQVIDTIVVGSSVLSTDTATKDEPFSPTSLSADDEIVWVDQTGADPFKYPEGYFALSNPELMQPQEIPNPDGAFPPIPGSLNNSPLGGANPIPGSGNLMDAPQQLPPSGGGVTGDIPKSPLGNIGGGNPTIPKYKFPKVRTPKNQKNSTLKNESPGVLDKLPTDETADANKANPNPTPTPAKSEPVAEVEINKAPLKTFAADVKTKVDKQEIDLTQNFKIIADGVLTKEGKLDVTIDKKTNQPKSRILTSDGNPQMVEVAKKAIEAIGDSGWLGYLRNQGIDKINFTVVQDNENLQVIITSDLATPERANTVTSGIKGAISFALLADKNNIKKLGDDERTLLNSAQAAQNPQNAKQFVLNFVMPKQTAQEMIKKKLSEPQEDPNQPKPNGTNMGQIKDDKLKTSK